jgi:hypothetical protein
MHPKYKENFLKIKILFKKKINNNKKCRECVGNLLGLEELINVPVIHSRDACALVLKHQAGWKLV